MKAAAIILAAFVCRVLGKVAVAGVNIAGCDFGINTWGALTGNSNCPSPPNGNGLYQMQHFVAEGLNIFRLPVSWQYLVNGNIDASLDQNNFGNYDNLVQACLQTGAMCVIDIHNYARWEYQIIGQQGGPPNEKFTSLWDQLARQYANQPNVVMGIMNEPHDLDIYLWAETVQEVVTTIRNAGAWSQWILLPGTGYTSAGDFQYSSGDALSAVTNPDGTTTNLFFDVHRYYDEGAGPYTDCLTDYLDQFTLFTKWLRGIRDNGDNQPPRMALITETGGVNTPNCLQYVCSALNYVNQNPDAYLGWIGWAAGNLDPVTDQLSESPDGNNQDTPLVSMCIRGEFV